MGRTSGGGDSDEDEIFYYRYATPSTSTAIGAAPSQSAGFKNGGGSGGLAPSKSTVYVSNIDYSLTNSDLFTIFTTFGKVARVTVVKDRITRRSKGVAFILFVSRDNAISAAKAMNGKVLNGRVLTASIANDNGRAPEFIRRRVYKDKSRCYECGEEGHLSYECPKNQLGPRERPVPKKGRRERERDWDDGYEFDDDNWGSVVDNGADQRLLMRENEGDEKKKGAKLKRASYFSDESGEED